MTTEEFANKLIFNYHANENYYRDKASEAMTGKDPLVAAIYIGRMAAYEEAIAEIKKVLNGLP